MARVIFIVLLVLGVYRIIRRLAVSRERPVARTRAAFEPTVRCRRCGAYVARRHAVVRGDGPICRIHVPHGDR